MKQYFYPDKEIWPKIIERPATDFSSLEKKVKKIMLQVKENGDKAVHKFSKKFDGLKVKSLVVSAAEIELAIDSLSSELKNAIVLAKKNIEIFHLTQNEEIMTRQLDYTFLLTITSHSTRMTTYILREWDK